MKAEFSAGRIQAYPDFDSDEPFILTTDCSSLNIAGILSQKQVGVERFLGCWGRKCNRYERHYSSTKGELLALVKCMKMWEHILKYQPPFLVYTDAASLKYIMNLKSEETIFQYWYAELAQFEFIVIHKKGSENVNTDALSRAKHLDEPTTEENEEYQEANEVGEMTITFASELEGNPVEIEKGRDSIVPIHWVYLIPKPDVEKNVSTWTETIQERFQTAYAGMRERQQQTVRRNTLNYKHILNQFNIGQWVWIFDPKIIPGSSDKLRSYWAGPYKIVRLMAPALAEVIAVYK